MAKRSSNDLLTTYDKLHAAERELLAYSNKVGLWGNRTLSTAEKDKVDQLMEATISAANAAAEETRATFGAE